MDMFNWLAENWRRLGLDAYGAPSRFSWLLLTPNPCHAAARHLILLVLDRASAQPVIVAKLPRLADDNVQIEREIRSLKLAQAARPAGFESIPRIITTAEIAGRRLLLETALHGKRMTPELVQHSFTKCAEAVVAWVIEFNLATADACGCNYHELIEMPLQFFTPMLACSSEDEWLMQRTLEATAPLRSQPVPAVFEHGDLFFPNILLANGSAGVLDWETGEPHSFPAGDLFFFLGYAAFARSGRYASSDCVRPFDQAFFPAAPWTQEYIALYVRALGLNPELLTPLFVAFWTRCLLTKAVRMHASPPFHHENSHPTVAVENEAAELHRTRDYNVWRHTLYNVSRLNWGF